MKNNEQVKRILSEFPKSKIHSITELAEANINEETIRLSLEKEK